jgi:hypothetical protein
MEELKKMKRVIQNIVDVGVVAILLLFFVAPS